MIFHLVIRGYPKTSNPKSLAGKLCHKLRLGNAWNVVITLWKRRMILHKIESC